MSCPSRCLTAVDTSFRRDPRGECPRSPGPARPHWPARGTHKCKFSAFLSELMECCWLTDREDRVDQDRKTRFIRKDRKSKEERKQWKERLFVVCSYYHKKQRGRPSWRLSVWRRRPRSRHHHRSNFAVQILTSLPHSHPSLSVCRPSPAESTSSPKCHDTIRERTSVTARALDA